MTFWALFYILVVNYRPAQVSGHLRISLGNIIFIKNSQRIWYWEKYLTRYKKGFQAKGGKSSFGPSQNKKDDFAIGGFSLDVSFPGFEIHSDEAWRIVLIRWSCTKISAKNSLLAEICQKAMQLLTSYLACAQTFSLV